MSKTSESLDLPSAAPQNRLDVGPLLLLAIAGAAAHLLIQNPYGYHRDELLLLELARHPAWAYADQNPLSIFLTRLTVATIGDAATAIRVLPVIANAATVLIIGLLTRELGGRAFAQGLAAFAALASPLLLRATSIMQPAAFDPLLWILTLFFAAAAIRREKPAFWLPFGLALGLALLNRFTAAALLDGVFIGLILTPHRRQLKSPMFWIGFAAAIAIAAPAVLWQQSNGWPYLEILNADAKVPALSLFNRIFLKIFDLTLAGTALALLGGVYCARANRAHAGPLLLLTLIFATTTFVATGERFLLPALLPMFAAGAVAIEQYIARHRAKRLAKRLAPAAAIIIAASGIFHAPTALTIHSIEDIDAYVRKLSLNRIENTDYITNHLHAFFGAETLAKDIARVMTELSPDEQKHCTVVTARQTHAAAINHLASEYALPLASSPHNALYDFGPQVDDPDVVIAVGLDLKIIHPLFGSVIGGDIVVDEHAPLIDTNIPVYICRRPLKPLIDMWPELRLMRP